MGENQIQFRGVDFEFEMGNSGSSSHNAFLENFTSQMKLVQKNRKADKRGKDFSLSAEAIEGVWKQISFEYPFMESVSDSAIMTSNKLKDQPIVFCNDDFMTLTGYPKEEILGRNCRFLQGKHTNPAHVQQIRDAIKEGRRLELELLNYRKDGVPFLNGFAMLPLHASGQRDGPVEYFIAIQKNVTVLVNPWRAPMKSWTVPEVCMWLDKNNAANYVKGFLQQDVNGLTLEAMTPGTLEACGVVLVSEQDRLLRLLDNEKALRSARGEHFSMGQLRGGESSMDDSTSVVRSESRVTQLEEDDDDDESLSEALQARAKASKGATGRKTVIHASFGGDCRPPVKLIVSSAYTNQRELRRVIRKKTGRKFDMQSLTAGDGLTSKMSLTLTPTFENLDVANFAVLEAIPEPVVVTDNVGLLVFANDASWNALSFEDDPVDTFILAHLQTSLSKLDSVQELRSNRLNVELKHDQSKWNVVINPVSLAKNRLFVWFFQPSE